MFPNSYWQWLRIHKITMNSHYLSLKEVLQTKPARGWISSHSLLPHFGALAFLIFWSWESWWNDFFNSFLSTSGHRNWVLTQTSDPYRAVEDHRLVLHLVCTLEVWTSCKMEFRQVSLLKTLALILRVVSVLLIGLQLIQVTWIYPLSFQRKAWDDFHALMHTLSLENALPRLEALQEFNPSSRGSFGEVLERNTLCFLSILDDVCFPLADSMQSCQMEWKMTFKKLIAAQLRGM